MKNLLRPGGIALTGTFLLVLGASTAFASSHNEAPFTSKHPAIDDTDFYMFRDPNDPSKVNLIANRFGLIEPARGPNFAGFQDGAFYDIHVDNDGDGVEDVTFRFTFTTIFRDPTTFLYALPGVTTIQDPKLLVVQTFDLDKITGPVANAGSGNTERLLTGAPVLPPNIGSKTFPDGYANLRNGVLTAGDRKVFTGPRQDPFFADLGMIFDAIHYDVPAGSGRPGQGVGATGRGKDTLYAYTVLSTSIQVSISELTKNHAVTTNVLDPNAIIGAWASVRFPRTQTLLPTGGFSTEGEHVQVSRLGNPLVNELLIGVGTKDKWNADVPRNEATYRTQELHPVLAVYMNVLFGLTVPGPGVERADIEAALFKGLPGPAVAGGTPPFGVMTTRPGEVYADELRLNTAIPPTPFSSASRFGVLGGDLAGYPNGRRICDDIIDIDLRVVAGVLLGAPYNTPPNTLLGDGVDSPQRGCRVVFPYMWSPTSGYDNLHTPSQNDAHAAQVKKDGFAAPVSDEDLERGGGDGRGSAQNPSR